MKTLSKRQFIKAIGIILFIFIGITDIQGQSYHQSLLTDKEWMHQIPGKTFYFTFFYTDTEEIVTLFENDVKSDMGEVKRSYYLSNNKVDKFQQDSVGKSKSGKYIAILSKPKIGEEFLDLYEILELNETTLKTKQLRSGVVLEYKAK